MKHIRIHMLCLAIMAVFLGGARCKKADTGKMGEILADTDTLHAGREYTLELEVPESLEGSVHRASWSVVPVNAGTITYTADDSFGVSMSYTADRTAVLTPQREGSLTVRVTMIHHPETNPQLFAEREFTVE